MKHGKESGCIDLEVDCQTSRRNYWKDYGKAQSIENDLILMNIPFLVQFNLLISFDNV